jgi:hypothetical protein
MSFQDLANAVVAEAKTLADDLKAAASGTLSTEVENYLPSLAPFLKAVASDAAAASGLLGFVPVIETLIAVAETYGFHPATGDELAELEETGHAGMSND